MAFWLVKSEPSSFSIEDLAARPQQTEAWDGVRNYQARNYLRDHMKKGDLVLFYHSNIPIPAIVGLCMVTREGYPDPTAQDPSAAHPDPRSTPDNPIWYQVDLKLVRIFSRPAALHTLKQDPRLEGMLLLQKGNRLSVMPVSAAHFQSILTLVQ
ncbi:EVE domain-containing protein [Desulfobotulus sp.]|jgi:predicted RNA-binding protein with PUA-like domain|uniref:EVE domain-containing protein n=1 Tax=Desulfobotulus sp. TaxID=1940337 RepID=UPI002A35EA68|nr:EVE domain-containing protein [Desulfobotulus sp.]MDY0164554.1 EVE domain-containing protein [Desulfobotulus sp.]